VTLNIEDFFDIPTAEIFNPDEFKAVRNVTIDSRKVKKVLCLLQLKGRDLMGTVL
jgi:hypothetical protein